MKKFLITFVASGVVFGVLTVISFLLFSTEPLSENEVARFGFPFVFSIGSIQNGNEYFSRSLLGIDLVFTVGICWLLVHLWYVDAQPMTFEQVIKKFTSRGLRTTDVLSYLSAGGDINHRDHKTEWSLLHFAAEDCNPEIVRLLASRGADLNVKDRFGQTPLHIAVDSDLDTSARGRRPAVDMPTARALIEAGADERSKNTKGETPRDFAFVYGQAELYDSIEKIHRTPR